MRHHVIAFWLRQENILEMLIKYPHLLTVKVGRCDNVDDVEKSVCLLYGIEKRLSKILMLPGIVVL